MNIENKKVLIIGLGKSGISAAKLCAKQGAKVTANDTKTVIMLEKELGILSKYEIEFSLGCTPDGIILDQDLVIISPGVPTNSKYLLKANLAGIPIWSEVELASRFCKCPIIAISGTNGKTTTTTLLGEMFKEANYNTYVLGNIGVPLSDMVDVIKSNDMVVLEVSAGQLETTETFRPIRSVMLNIKPEHMNLYKTFNAYISIKEKLFNNQLSEDIAIINWDDVVVREISGRILAKKIFFSFQEELTEGVFIKDEAIHIRYGELDISLCKSKDIKVKGIMPNILATIAMSISMNISIDVILRVITGYKGKEHVIEYVENVDGVTYYNDSKATNPWSTIHAINSIDENIILITGGKDDKKSDFTDLATTSFHKVKQVIVIGETASKVMNKAKEINYSNITKSDSLENAIIMAHSQAVTNDVVLFSPGANSKDMFLDHRQRGQLFKKFVRELSMKVVKS